MSLYLWHLIVPMHLVFDHDAQQWYNGSIEPLDLSIRLWMPGRVERVFDSSRVAKGFRGFTRQTCAAVTDK